MSRRLAVVVALAGVLVLFFALDLGRFLSLEFLQQSRGAFQDFHARHPIATPLLFFLAYVVVTGASLPGAAIMTLAAGALFGVAMGVVLASFASSLGATIAFLTSRFLLGNWVEQRFRRQLASVHRGIERDGAFYLLTLRIVPLFPFFVVNALMGMTRMRVRTFHWVSQLGMLPGTFVFVLAGTEVARLQSLGDIMNPRLLLALLLLGIFPLLARAALGIVARRRIYRGHRRPRVFDANVIVIGAGSAGLIASLVAATVRARVFLIERNRMGGDCLYTGCVPSKTLIRSARVAQLMREGAQFGLESVEPRVDLAAVMARVRGVIADIEPKDSRERYETLGVECVQGSARLVDPWTVDVDGRRLTARAIVVATGAEPAVPAIPGLDAVPYLTSESLWSLTALPARLVVIGGGPIGCELAQAFARLGSRVTLLDATSRILGKEDPDVSSLLQARFEREGMRVLTMTRAVAARPGELDVERGDGTRETLRFDQLLVAVGRKPRTEGLGLDALGIEIAADGTIVTDLALATRFPNIFACGDIAGPYQFTHMASYQAEVAATNALLTGLYRRQVDYGAVPWATYTDPEVAHVGLNEQQARAEGIAFEVTRLPLEEIDRARAEGDTEGFVKVLTEAGTDLLGRPRDRILGATVVGAHAGELVAEFVGAMQHGIGLAGLMRPIRIYPTLMEAPKAVAGVWRRAHAPAQLLAIAGRFNSWRRAG